MVVTQILKFDGIYGVPPGWVTLATYLRVQAICITTVKTRDLSDLIFFWVDFLTTRLITHYIDELINTTPLDQKVSSSN